MPGSISDTHDGPDDEPVKIPVWAVPRDIVCSKCDGTGLVTVTHRARTTCDQCDGSCYVTVFCPKETP